MTWFWIFVVVNCSSGQNPIANRVNADFRGFGFSHRGRERPRKGIETIELWKMVVEAGLLQERLVVNIAAANG